MGHTLLRLQIKRAVRDRLGEAGLHARQAAASRARLQRQLRAVVRRPPKIAVAACGWSARAGEEPAVVAVAVGSGRRPHPRHAGLLGVADSDVRRVALLGGVTRRRLRTTLAHLTDSETFCDTASVEVTESAGACSCYSGSNAGIPRLHHFWLYQCTQYLRLL